MKQRAEIINQISKASSLQEQAALVAELDAFDRRQRQATASANAIDLASAVVEQTLTPVLSYERSTIATDWLGEVTSSVDPGQASQQITVEASLWYRRLSPEVVADTEEFGEQARGMAHRVASAYGEHAEGLEKQFLEYTAFLRQREAASGLPQVEQIVDSHENPSLTPLPQDVFPTFADPVHPINQGVTGTETSERAPLLQEIEAEGQGQGQAEVPNHHDTAPQPYTYAEVPPQEARTAALDAPTLAISHVATLDQYREIFAREAASGLPQVEQIVDAVTEQPAVTPLPEEVAYPWLIAEQAEVEDPEQAKKAAYQRRAAYVAGLAQRDPATLTDVERKEVLAFTASLQKQADQWSQSGPQFHGPGPANSPASTPERPVGTYADGFAAGSAAWPEQAPTFADASPSVPEYVQGYTQGYQEAKERTPVPGAATPGDMPIGAGNPNPVTHAASQKVASRQADPAPSLRVSARLVTAAEAEHPEFTKGYRYASRWAPGKRLVSVGSAEFEAGLYAGISDNAAQQQAWAQAHRTAAKEHQAPGLIRRLTLHREFSKQAARVMTDLRVVGGYLALRQEQAKTAATVTDMETMLPSTMPSPTGQTPINGPGTPGPLAGGMDAAAPGGPAPYNGAPPFGAPVVPGGPAAHGVPTAISTTPGGPVDQAAMERLSPQTMAFRKTVQASLLKTRQGE